MSEYTKNAIYTRVRNAIKTAYPDANVTASINKMPSKFPTVYIHRSSYFEPTSVLTLSNAQDFWDWTFNVQVWTDSSSKQEDAYNIMSVARRAFKDLGFFQSSDEGVIDDGAESTIFKLTSNFRRLIGSGESMPSI